MSSANSTTGPASTNQNVFNNLFGQKTCIPFGYVFGMFVALAAVATVLFVLLAYVKTDKYFEGWVANPNSRLGLKALIFFILMIFIVWAFYVWFNANPACTDK